MISKKRNIIWSCCFCILILFGCFGYNQQKLSKNKTVIKTVFIKHDAAKLEQEKSKMEAIQIVVSEDDEGNAVLIGKNTRGEDFYINLDYSIADIIVRDSYFIDLTEDGIAELCIELNIWNSASPNMNTILVYDVENREMLFPNKEKPFIYDGDVIMLGETKVILYRNLDKINGASIESECSAVRWNGSDFETVNYYSKLLAKTDEYVLIYDNTDDFSDTHAYKIMVLNPLSLNTIQEIKIVSDKEVDIVGKINQGILVGPDITMGKKTSDLYIEGYGILHWDDKRKSFETIPLPNIKETKQYQPNLKSHFIGEGVN